LEFKAHIRFGKGSSLKGTNCAVLTVIANSCVGETEMEDAGLHFVEFYFCSGREEQSGANKKKHTNSNTHGEVFKKQLEIHYGRYLG